MDVLRRYAQALTAASSKLVIVSASERIQDQLRVTGVTDLISPQDIYTGDERVGATLKRAYADATTWIERNRPGAGPRGECEDVPPATRFVSPKLLISLHIPCARDVRWLCLTVAWIGCGAGLRAWRGLGLSGRFGSLGGAADWGQSLDGEVGDHDGDDDERGRGDSGFRGQQEDDDGC